MIAISLAPRLVSAASDVLPVSRRDEFVEGRAWTVSLAGGATPPTWNACAVFKVSPVGSRPSLRITW